MSHRTRERPTNASLSHSTMIGLPRAQHLVHSLQMYCKLLQTLYRNLPAAKRSQETQKTYGDAKRTQPPGNDIPLTHECNKQKTNTFDENQSKEQAGRRSEFSTMGHIHVLRQILQKYREYNKVYYLDFVDFNKAFDSVEHYYIWESLEHQGIHRNNIPILRNIYGKSTGQIKLERMDEEFSIERRLGWDNYGLNVNSEKLNHLRYAQDLILLEDLGKNVQRLSDESINADFSMNVAKIMSHSSQKEDIKIDDQQLEYVNEYIYLGKLVSPTENVQKEIERRIANTWKTFWSLSDIMKNKEMPKLKKRKVFNTYILPCLNTLLVRKQIPDCDEAGAPHIRQGMISFCHLPKLYTPSPSTPQFSHQKKAARIKGTASGG
ncbi:hypothetical protein EVAR_57265_1 [Eumeta japonica]|uniref:Reverse transcriptase domain-containing protein n=1 Tax=Eumeta variegata TaxID=151549 RepID=A0A4C1ZMB0_EUMVA|nr:hypothetical protein EVAR_57265_1 [Eumeta japonica]